MLGAALALLLAFGLHAPGRPGGVGAAEGAPPKIAPTLQQQMLAAPTKPRPVIVEMEYARWPFVTHPNASRAQQALDLLRQYGRPVGTLPLLGAAAGFADAAGIAGLASVPGVAFVHEDAPVGPWRAAPAPWPPAAPAAVYPRVVGADLAWREGVAGRGVTVAVLDSGVAPDPDLTQPTNRLLAAANFAGPRGALADPGGHGTHIAGVLAGNGTRAEGQYVGVAPQAALLDVRVLSAAGRGRVSSVVRGLGWALAQRARYNVRILNLSFGAPPPAGGYRGDPLAAAVEVAWRRGLVVVTAAGNGGPNGGTVETPGIDPYVLTVGATDDRGSVTTLDDRLAWFSAWGTPPGGVAKPDLVAPGRRLVSLRVPGSTLDRLYPDRVVAAADGATYFRLTGTSMATAVVSGAAALVLQRQPGLSPDQVKALLRGTARPYGLDGGAGAASGRGLLDAYGALRSSAPAGANRGLRPADGLARALYPVLYGQPLLWRDPFYGGIDWRALSWATLAWDAAAWDNLDWDAFRWSDAAWDDGAWDDAAWDDAAWDDAAWDDAAWDDAAWDCLTLD